MRTVLFLLAIAAFAASLYTAYRSELNAEGNAKKAASFEAQFNAAQQTINQTNSSVLSVSATVNDLAMLNRLSSRLFHVRISAGDDLVDLRKTATAIGAQLPGALKSGMIRLLPTPPNKHSVQTKYELLFGRDLTLAAAGVFHRLSIDHGFANGRPFIEVETEAERKGDLPLKQPGA